MSCPKCGRPARKRRRHRNANVEKALQACDRVCLYCSAVEYLAGGFEPRLLSELGPDDQQAARDEAIELREQLLAKPRRRSRRKK